jgi:hypothetical protein
MMAGFMIAPLATRAAAKNVQMLLVPDLAQICIEDGCSLETVEDLLHELKNTAQTASGKKKAATLELYSQLKALTATAASMDANKSEIEKLISGASRSFGTVEGFDFPGPAIGYSGVPGTTTTAGKSLE